MCKDYYGRSGQGRCCERANFCDMCCEFHIGISYPTKRVDCKRRCTKRIKGKGLSSNEKKKNNKKISKLVKKMQKSKNKKEKKKNTKKILI